MKYKARSTKRDATGGEAGDSISSFVLHTSHLPLIAFDEFTSVVDRNVARIGSAAVAKAIRGGTIGCRFVAVTCHYDVTEWLAPDWVIDMATATFTRRCSSATADRA